MVVCLWRVYARVTRAVSRAPGVRAYGLRRVRALSRCLQLRLLLRVFGPRCARGCCLSAQPRTQRCCSRAAPAAPCARPSQRQPPPPPPARAGLPAWRRPTRRGARRRRRPSAPPPRPSPDPPAAATACAGARQRFSVALGCSARLRPLQAPPPRATGGPRARKGRAWKWPMSGMMRVSVTALLLCGTAHCGSRGCGENQARNGSWQPGAQRTHWRRCRGSARTSSSFDGAVNSSREPCRCGRVSCLKPHSTGGLSGGCAARLDEQLRLGRVQHRSVVARKQDAGPPAEDVAQSDISAGETESARCERHARSVVRASSAPRTP